MVTFIKIKSIIKIHFQIEKLHSYSRKEYVFDAPRVLLKQKFSFSWVGEGLGCPLFHSGMPFFSKEILVTVILQT